MAAAAKATPVLSIKLNQAHDCFICGLQNGFKVFSCHPLQQKETQFFEDGGIGKAEMLFRCNFLAMVGGGRKPKFATTKVMIWDDRKKAFVIELPFRSEVRGLRLRRDRIVVALDAKTVVFSFTKSPQQLHVFKTFPNHRGLCELCPEDDNSILVLPGLEKGQVQVIDLANPKRPGPVIAAHSGALACICLNRSGTHLATASDKGTLIRVFETASGNQLHELRRGSGEADITCINFSPDSTLLCVSSNHPTIHIFALPKKDGGDSSKGGSTFLPSSLFSAKSVAKFTVSCPSSVCTFSDDGKTVIVICHDGSFYRCRFSAKGEPEMTIQNFLKGSLGGSSTAEGGVFGMNEL
eukprot:m.133359 g.133359  ORF g.133359 m.133359 type:complete len:352 (+) comp13833_c1_seq4:311-1366(+)